MEVNSSSWQGPNVHFSMNHHALSHTGLKCLSPNTPINKTSWIPVLLGWELRCGWWCQSLILRLHHCVLILFLSCTTICCLAATSAFVSGPRKRRGFNQANYSAAEIWVSCVTPCSRNWANTLSSVTKAELSSVFHPGQDEPRPRTRNTFMQLPEWRNKPHPGTK